MSETEAGQKPSQIVMYGTTWCPDCARSKRFLERHGVGYEWVNIEEDPEAATLVRRVNSGMQVVPTILFPDGSVLAEPSDRELGTKLGLR